MIRSQIQRTDEQATALGAIAAAGRFRSGIAGEHDRELVAAFAAR